jgi:hypothetical protein
MGQVGIPFGYSQEAAAVYNYFYSNYLKDTKFILGAANPDLPSSIVKQYLADNFDLGVYPAAPDPMDDEFEVPVINGKWTKFNDPVAPNAFSTSLFPGFLWLGIPAGASTYGNMPQFYQAAPPDLHTFEFIARVAIATQRWGNSTNSGRRANVTLALSDSVGGSWLGASVQINAATTTLLQSVWGAMEAAGAWANMPTTRILDSDTAELVWIKLVKADAFAYTALNHYYVYMSYNGAIWYEVASGQKAFANPCDRIGFIFRRPDLESSWDPIGYALVDSFRRIN